jgi:hypothetical protein
MNAWIDVDIEEAGRVLGHDFYTQSFLPKQAHWPACVCQGFEAAAHVGLRRQRSDRFVNKWLQLRLSAWRRGRVVADDVTPDLLREIDVDQCPVTRVTLTHGMLLASDWSVDRLNNDAAYAASNLAVMSVKANGAKGALNFEQAHARSRQGRASDGLEPVEWLRLAVLMLGPAFATNPHAAPALPLCAPLPARAVRLALQQIQRLFIEHCPRLSGKNRLIRELTHACSSDSSRLKLSHLGGAVHEGLRRIDAPHECWDVWLYPPVMQALVRWKDALDDPGWARAAAIAGRLSESRRETPERLGAWHLPTRGFTHLNRLSLV